MPPENAARTGRKIQHLSAIPAKVGALLLPNLRGAVASGLYGAGKVWSTDTKRQSRRRALRVVRPAPILLFPSHPPSPSVFPFPSHLTLS